MEDTQREELIKKNNLLKAFSPMGNGEQDVDKLPQVHEF